MSALALFFDAVIRFRAFRIVPVGVPATFGIPIL